MSRAGKELVQCSDGFVVAAERVVDERLVIGELLRFGGQAFGLFEGLEGEIVVTLAALDLRDVNLREGILRLDGDDELEDLEGFVELAVGQESCG